MKKLTSILCALVIALSAIAAPQLRTLAAVNQPSKMSVRAINEKRAAYKANPAKALKAQQDAATSVICTGLDSGVDDGVYYYVLNDADENYYLFGFAVQPVSGQTYTLSDMDAYYNYWMTPSYDFYDYTAATFKLTIDANSKKKIEATFTDEAGNNVELLYDEASLPDVPEGGTYTVDEFNSNYYSSYKQLLVQMSIESIGATVVLWINVSATDQDVVSGKTYSLTDMDGDYCYISINGQKIYFTSIQFTKTVSENGDIAVACVIVDENGSTWNLSYAKTAPQLVVLPDGATVVEYTMDFTNPSSGAADAKSINVAVAGDKVYFQGMSGAFPESWVVGTKADNTITFEVNQFVGNAGSPYGEAYFFVDNSAYQLHSVTEFTYDAQADTYSATGLVMGFLTGAYYDGRYNNPVLSKAKEPDFEHPFEVVATKMSFTPYNSSYGDVIYELSNAAGDTIITFDIYVYADEVTDVIEGKTYTMEQMETSSTYTYVQTSDGKIGLKQVSFVKTVDSDNLVHIEATIVDNKVNVFHVVYDEEKEAPTAVEAANAEVKSVKRIVNGQVVIEKNGVRYNLLGTEIK